MVFRIAAALTLFSCVLFARTVNAQAGDRYLDTEARVLDMLFPLDVAPKPYFLKLVLRFGDSDTQLVVVTYPGGKSELIRYSLAGMTKGEFTQLVSKMVAENPGVKDEDIAAKLKLDVRRSPVDDDALDRALNDLKAIRISPMLATRVAVDESSEFEFWCDTWQESVHYTITSPFNDASQDQLGRWMIKFRDNVPNLLKASLGPTPAKPGRGEK